MRTVVTVLLLAACSSSAATTEAPDPRAALPQDAVEMVPPILMERMAADTPRATVAGHTFVAPIDWRVGVKGPMTLLAAPEAGSFLAFVDVTAPTPEDAVAQAWAAYGSTKVRRVTEVWPAVDTDGWTRIADYTYETSPAEQRFIEATVRFASGRWSVVIYDMANAVSEKRSSQWRNTFGSFLPKGFVRESFAGQRAHALDAGRLRELATFVERAQQQLGVPGVGVGLVQDGKVVFRGGFGVREVGKPGKVDADTRFMIWSVTKPLTTLLLGTLVDEGTLSWDMPAASVFPKFRLGDPDVTQQVLIKHLISASTGMPRQDLEWQFEFDKLTPDGVIAMLGTMQPTSKFGELFQYSNPMAAVAGYLAGHVVSPALEPGEAYDEAMRTRVFEPLGMRATTFDFDRATAGNYASNHGQSLDGKVVPLGLSLSRAVIPVRPAGGAWSTVDDLLAYVQLELAAGTLPDGRRFVSPEVLHARRAPQVAAGSESTYGMGLYVSRRSGVTCVFHRGAGPGWHSHVFWFPEHAVGAVILTNGHLGRSLCAALQRKLFELLFDAKPEADAQVAVEASSYATWCAGERTRLKVPPDPAAAARLADLYASPALGEMVVRRAGATVVFDFGEWQCEVASRSNADGTMSFVGLTPGPAYQLEVRDQPTRALILRDAQHVYVFEAR